jgi:hypothetical protein
MDATINNSERSIETKLTKLYSATYFVIDNSVERFTWNEAISNSIYSCASNDDSLNRESIQRDKRIDRLKGMVYGLVIGHNRSKGRTFSDLLVLAKKLNDALSSLINTQDSHSDKSKFSECESLLQRIISELFEYKKKEHFRGCDRSIVDKLRAPCPDEETRRNAENFGIDEFCKQCDSDEKICHFESFSGKTVPDLQNYIRELNVHIKKFFPDKKIEPIQLPLLDSMRIKSFPLEENELLSNLLNVLLDEDDPPEMIAKSRYEFGVWGGTKIKELLAANFEGEYRTYINSLFRNLNESEPFDIGSTKSPALKAFAALCKKGEKGELESFYDYLISNGISDVTVAFALWGAVYGFACMPKTVTKELFDESDSLYVSEIYKHTHKQLFGEELIDKSIKELTKPEQLSPQVCVQGGAGPSGESPVSDKTDSSGHKPWTQEQLKNKPIKDLKTIAKKLGLKISKYPKDKLIQAILNKQQQPDLFNKDITNPKPPLSSCNELFYLDGKAFEKVKHLVPPENQDNLKKEITYIQRCYVDGSYTKKDGTRIVYNDKSNKSAIDSLRKNMMKSQKKISKSEIEKVCVQLTKEYP